MTTFTLQYWEDEGWFVGRLRGVPAVMSQGETLEELQENIRDAYALVMASERSEKAILRRSADTAERLKYPLPLEAGARAYLYSYRQTAGLRS